MKSSNKSKSPQGQFSQHFDFIKNICKFYYQNINFFKQKMKILMNISLKMRTSRIPKAILSLLPLPTSTAKKTLIDFLSHSLDIPLFHSLSRVSARKANKQSVRHREGNFSLYFVYARGGLEMEKIRRK